MILSQLVQGRTYTPRDMEYFLLTAGGDYPSVGHAREYLVEKGLIAKIGHGQYRLASPTN